MQPSVHAVRRLSLNRFALWTSAIGAAIVIGVLSLMLVSNQPINKTNTATINQPASAVSSGHEDDVLSVEWLTQRKATTPAMTTTHEDDVLSVEWLTQRNAANASQPKPLEGAGHHGNCTTTLLPALCP